MNRDARQPFNPRKQPKGELAAAAGRKPFAKFLAYEVSVTDKA